MSSTISPTRPGEATRLQLALSAEQQLLAPEPGDEHPLDQQKRNRDQSQRQVLYQDEGDRYDDLAAQKHRLHEGVADEAAERLHLVADHGRDLGTFHAAEFAVRKAQDPVDEFVPELAEHALAQPALVEVDVIFEQAVDDHQQQEERAQDHQRPDAIEIEPVQELDEAIVLDGGRDRNPDLEVMLGRGSLFEALRLDRPIHDVLGQVQHGEVEGHRRQNDQQDPDLLLSGLGPDVAKKTGLHAVPELRPA